MDPLAELASTLHRPPASLAALSALEPDQLRLLADAIDASCERRRRGIEADLERAMPRPVARVLRAPGLGRLRHLLERTR